jgi:type II secretory pathway component PulJ
MILRPQRSGDAGLGALAVIVALLIAALLYLGYFKMQSAMQQPKQAVSTLDASKAFACKTNRQTIERELQMWLVNHPGETPSLAALAADGGGTAHCPEGGEYTLDGPQVRCSRHD